MSVRPEGPSRSARFVPARRVATLLLFALPAGAITSAAVRPNSLSAKTGTLRLTSVPEGAIVFLDGAKLGLTPLTIDSVTPAEHRIRIVKPGYVEHGERVTVTPGRVLRVRARLTAEGGVPDAKFQSKEQRSGSASRKRVLLALGAAVAGAGAYLLLRDPDRPLPDPSRAPTPILAIDAGGNAALAAVTSVRFDGSQSSDPDGDPLRFEWSFGDGSPVTSGAIVNHVYEAAGVFSATLSVSDGNQPVLSTRTVVVRSMTDEWSLEVFPANACDVRALFARMTLVQNGRSVYGTYERAPPFPPSPRAPVTGAVSEPRRVQLTFLPAIGFEALGDSDLQTFRGTLGRLGCGGLLRR